MHLSMFILAVVYAVLVFAVTKRIFWHLVYQSQKEIVKLKYVYQELTKNKGNLYFEKSQLQEKTNEVFTLYEMTKEISKNFDEKDVFNILRNKLKETIVYEECHWLNPDSDELKELKKRDDYFLFPLKGKKALLGYLAIKGVSLDDKESIVILAHQFALGLQRINLYQEIEKLAITDSLTGVYTRRYIMEYFKEELERSRAKKIHLSFLMIDVDYFKRFNDRFGHLTGDRILRGVAENISESIREIDIVGRYGGEEFCVILPETDREGAYYVAERIRSSMEKIPIKAYETTVRTTVSIGIVTFPEDAQKISGLIDKADWALYRAKKMGRNTSCAFGVYDSN